MSKIPSRAEDYMLPENMDIIMLKTYGGEQILCQLGGDEYIDGAYLILNPYTVDDDALYGKWISGIDYYKGNDPHVYVFPVNQVAAMLPTSRIHIRILEQYKRAIGI